MKSHGTPPGELSSYQAFEDLIELAKQSPDDAVTTLYVEILGRFPDKQGLADHGATLARGVSIGELAEGLANSPEALAHGRKYQKRAHALVTGLKAMETLHKIGAETEGFRHRQRDGGDLLEAGDLDPALMSVITRDMHTLKSADVKSKMQWYMALSEHDRPRKLIAGFNPQIYAEAVTDYLPKRDGDPHTDWIRRGRPAGPWKKQVIRADDAAAATTGLRILVHGHYYYPELIGDLLNRLKKCKTVFDLVLTTNTREKARLLEILLAEQGFRARQIVIVPNIGRDVGPFLTGIRDLVPEYDVVVHLHGKKSPAVLDASKLEEWKRNLYESLVGGLHPMFDTIAEAFAAEPKLGLVAPEDPYIEGWHGNRTIAKGLKNRLGLQGPLPKHLDFPVGTMFWARTDAIKPMFDADFKWEDYPSEPIPDDGTMLHALERLIPFVVEQQGYTYATAYVPEVFANADED